MGALWLINFVLIAFPIGTTVGVLMGMETHRTSTGQSPLFRDNGIKTKGYCQKTIGISPPSKGEHYTRKKTPRPTSNAVCHSQESMNCAISIEI